MRRLIIHTGRIMPDACSFVATAIGPACLSRACPAEHGECLLKDEWMSSGGHTYVILFRSMNCSMSRMSMYIFRPPLEPHNGDITSPNSGPHRPSCQPQDFSCFLQGQKPSTRFTPFGLSCRSFNGAISLHGRVSPSCLSCDGFRLISEELGMRLISRDGRLQGTTSL
jgi:hypothetical protein